jgi:glycosyltransferase involved in cell wall biosynthesis
MADKKRILFHRNYKKFSGGHLKVFDYFNHAKSSNFWVPEIFFTPSSKPDHPWRCEGGIVRSFDPNGADCLFIAGLDWNALSPFPGVEARIPVLNLIQHIRHAEPDDPRHAFLSRRAIRICVSPEVADVLESTRRCNGPIHVISNGIDFALLPELRACVGVFIAGMKRPGLANALCARLRARSVAVECRTELLDRAEFLRCMASARIVVTLPNETEGFFLPPLEAMALGRAVICPDCVGNRSFCIDGETCLMPLAEPLELEAAVMRLISDPGMTELLSAAAAKMSKRFDLKRERADFLTLLNSLR